MKNTCATIAIYCLQSNSYELKPNKIDRTIIMKKQYRTDLSHAKNSVYAQVTSSPVAVEYTYLFYLSPVLSLHARQGGAVDHFSAEDSHNLEACL